MKSPLVNIFPAALFCIVSLFFVLPGDARAAQTSFENSLGYSISSLECYNSQATPAITSLSGRIKNGSTVQFDPQRLAGCERILLSVSDTDKFQLFMPDDGAQYQDLSIHAGAGSKYSDWSFPLLLGENKDDMLIVPAGVPFELLIQAVSKGVSVEELFGLLYPISSDSFDYAQRAVSFRFTSWDLVGLDDLRAEGAQSDVVELQIVGESDYFGRAEIVGFFAGLGATPRFAALSGPKGDDKEYFDDFDGADARFERTLEMLETEGEQYTLFEVTCETEDMTYTVAFDLHSAKVVISATQGVLPTF